MSDLTGRLSYRYCYSDRKRLGNPYSSQIPKKEEDDESTEWKSDRPLTSSDDSGDPPMRQEPVETGELR